MVKTAARTLDVFEAFMTSGAPASLSELARAIRAPVASCFGIVRTLEQRGYLYSIGSRRRLYPTKRLLETARLIAAHDPLAERLAPVLAALRDGTRETVLLAQRTRHGIVLLDVLEGPQTVRYTARIGDLKPLHSSASGKALLATLPDPARRAALAEVTLTRLTPLTITSRRALEADLAAGRVRGWWVSRGETVVDVMAVATSLEVNDETFAIAVAGPVHRMDLDVERHAAALLAARRRVEKSG